MAMADQDSPPFNALIIAVFNENEVLSVSDEYGIQKLRLSNSALSKEKMIERYQGSNLTLSTLKHWPLSRYMIAKIERTNEEG